MSEKTSCAYCGKGKPLVESPILDKGFFPASLEGAPHPGVRDAIVCEDCAGLFQAWDAAAAELLLEGRERFERADEFGHPVLKREPYDYAGLKLFALSLLWRAAVSEHRWCAKVKLGPFEEPLRKALRAKDPGKSDWMPVLLIHRAPGPEAAAMGPLVSDRDWGVRVYRIPLAGWQLVIQVDALPFPPMNEAALAPDRPLVAQSEQFAGSFGVKYLKHIALDDPRLPRPK